MLRYNLGRKTDLLKQNFERKEKESKGNDKVRDSLFRDSRSIIWWELMASKVASLSLFSY